MAGKHETGISLMAVRVPLTSARDRAYQRLSYQRHRERRLGDMREFREKNAEYVRLKKRFEYAQGKAIIAEALSVGCIDCGEKDIDVLQFDHVFGKRETRQCVSAMAKSRLRLLAEIAKCEIRCANCHARATKRRKREAVNNG